MKKTLLFLFLIFPLLASCNDNDNLNDEEPPVNNTIDKRLVGKWKVEYSKTIRPAVYIENEEELKDYPEIPDLHLGLNYPDAAVVTEYFGNYNGHISQKPQSGLFNSAEFKIEINDDNKIIISPSGSNNQTILYKIENSYLIWLPNSINLASYGIIRYELKKDTLILDLIKIIKDPHQEYRISKYSKITE